MPGSTNIEAGMKHPTWPDYVRAWWWTRLARLVPVEWGPGFRPEYWSHGEPVRWQARVWCEVLGNAYYCGELVDGRIPEDGDD